MVVPTTPYQHAEHGRVVVQAVADDTVYFDIVGETIHGTDQPLCGRQPREAFEAATEPAEQGVSLPTAEIAADEPSLGGPRS